MNDNLLFFTAVDNGYEDFLPLYIYFANKYNENSSFEFLIKNLSNNFINLIKNFQNKFKIKNILLRNFNDNIRADSLRWLEEPLTKCNYTYIGDVDIFINENILPFHLSEMKKYNTIYDNKIRLNNNNFMSGLHFIKSDEWYKATKNVRIKYFNFYSTNKNTYNELLLKLIINESKINILNNLKENTFNRPIHGLHISLNRIPFTTAMGFQTDLYKKMIINDFFKTDDWKIMQSFLSEKMINILNTCNEYVKNR